MQSAEQLRFAFLKRRNISCFWKTTHRLLWNLPRTCYFFSFIWFCSNKTKPIYKCYSYVFLDWNVFDNILRLISIIQFLFWNISDYHSESLISIQAYIKLFCIGMLCLKNKWTTMHCFTEVWPLYIAVYKHSAIVSESYIRNLLWYPKIVKTRLLTHPIRVNCASDLKTS